MWVRSRLRLAALSRPFFSLDRYILFRFGRRTRPVEQDLLFGHAADLALLADEFERAIQRLDGALERAFGVAPAQLQLGDVALEGHQPSLRPLDEQSRALLRLVDDQLGFFL